MPNKQPPKEWIDAALCIQRYGFDPFPFIESHMAPGGRKIANKLVVLPDGDGGVKLKRFWLTEDCLPLAEKAKIMREEAGKRAFLDRILSRYTKGLRK